MAVFADKEAWGNSMAASFSQPETIKAEYSLENPKACYSETSDPMLHVTLLGGEWSSSAGGLSTLNRELAIHLSNHSAVKVSLLVPEGACNYEEKNEAHTYGITIVEAKRLAAFDRLDWLSFPPHEHLMDIVVGHGVKLGRQIQVIRDSARFTNCKWVQVVHTAPEDLSKYKCYGDPISKGETKHESEVELCKLADLVVPVGPKLKEAYTSYLQRCKTADRDVLTITPGLFQREFGDLVAKQDPNKDSVFKVLLFGRGDDEDFELKGYNIAAKAFTDQRLKNKPYHLIFVGAPEGKQEEVRGKLLQRGIADAQLTVRKFIQSRDRLKDLLCEADLAVMPSKSEGFGLVALEALSAGLPILVGSKSGFAKALENVLIGFSCIVNSDDPVEWAKAIEGVRIRHRMKLEEIKSLRKSYGKMYSWKKQCEALVSRMWKISHEDSLKARSSSQTKCNASQRMESMTDDHEEPPIEIDNNQRTNSYDGEQLVSETSLSSDCEMKADAASGNPTKISTNTDSQSQNSDSVLTTAFIEVIVSSNAQHLTVEQQRTITKELEQLAHKYRRHQDLSSLPFVSRVARLAEFIEKAFEVVVLFVQPGSLIITIQCPSLQSLESLWNAYCSGYLNDVVESFLVTDELKRKLGLDKVRLKTTIEEENYLICKKAFMENSGVASITETSCQTVDSGQVEDTRWSEESSDVVKDKEQALTPMATAEKAKIVPLPCPDQRPSDSASESTIDSEEESEASKGSLHRAAVSGQHETDKELLESIEDVDQSDEIAPLPRPDRRPSDSGSESPKERKEESKILPTLLVPKSKISDISRTADSGYHSSITEETREILPWRHLPRRCSSARSSASYYGYKSSITEDETREVCFPETSVPALHVTLLSGVAGITETSSQKAYPGPVEDTRWSEKSLGVAKDKKLGLGHMERAEKAKASRGPLLKAAISGQCETVKMLLESGEDVDQRDQFSLTPLHLACWYGQESVVKLLLKHGANVHAKDRFQRTPLQKAERQNHHSIVQLLLKNNAKPSLHQPVCLKKLSRKAFLQVDEQSGFNMLQAAVFEGKYDIVLKANGLLENFLEEMEHTRTGNNAKGFPGKTAADILSLVKGAKSNHYSIERLYKNWAENNSRLTELQWGTCNDDVELAVELVLNDGVDINASGSDNDWTALLQASRSSSSQFINTLIDLGADVNAQRKDDKVTPLILATEWSNYMAACLFLRHGANVDVQGGNGFTPLHVSVNKDHENLIRLLLKHKGDVNIQDYSGHTPLHRCVTEGNENIGRLLLEHNADVNKQNQDGCTPLHLSVNSGFESLVRLFLELNADVEVQDKEGYTALHRSVTKNNENFVRLLLKRNANVNIKNANGYTPLHQSVLKGNETLVRLLLEHKADVNIQDNNGQTPLHWCDTKDNENLARLLIEHNADVNIQDYQLYTPLHLCVIKANENLCRLLLKFNADVNIQDKDGYTPLHQCVIKSNENLCRLIVAHNAEVNIQDRNGCTPLHKCVKNGNENLCKLLVEHNSDVNLKDLSGCTPLHWCVMTDDESLCRLLLEHNADVNIQDESGCTPLHKCVMTDDESLCRLLLEHNVDVNIQDESGCTPLHYGVREGNENLCKLLLENNAKVNIQDKGGQTPLHQSVTKSDRYWYRARDCSQIIDLLIKYGVQDIDIRDAKGRTPLQLARRSHNYQAVEKLLDLGADFSVVTADKSGAIRRERLKNTAERMERHLKFDAISVQETKETEAATSVTIVPGAEKLTQSHFKLKEMLRQTPSHTTEKTEDQPKAEQAKTMGESHPKSMATSSSRTN